MPKKHGTAIVHTQKTLYYWFWKYVEISFVIVNSIKLLKIIFIIEIKKFRLK